jgi:protein-disulfide isomerase
VSKRANAKSIQAARIVRDQLEKERRQKRAMWVTVSAVVLLLVAGVVGFAVWQSQRPTSYAVPSGALNDGGDKGALLSAGDGPVTVEVYLDYICPVCKQFEASTQPTLDQMIVDKKIRLVWHPLGFLDQNSTTRYSTRAASAAACAFDYGKLKEYGEALFAQQPAEGSAGLSDDQLVSIGGSVGLTQPAFAQCVRDGKYKSWVGHVNDLAAKRGVNGTPTIYINGKLIQDRSPEGVKAAVAAAS